MKVLAFPAFKNKKSNPYNYLLYSGIEGVDVSEFSFSKALKLDYDLIHIHWPEWYLNSNYYVKALFYSVMLLFCLGSAKLAGRKIVWTVHNLKPHDIKYKWLNDTYWKLFIKLVDGTISLSSANQQIVEKNFSFKKSLKKGVVYHGLYTGIYENNISKEDAKKLFGIDSNTKTCLFLGQVKKYKNVDELVRVFNSSSALSSYVLLIAGKFESEEHYQEVMSARNENKNILIFNRFIPDDEMQNFFNASDLSILPFKRIFNSGSALLSVTFNTPVLLPESNNFLEYKGLIENNIMQTFKGKLTPEVITNAFNQIPSDPFCKGNYYCNYKLSWVESQKRLSLFYKNVMGGKK